MSALFYGVSTLRYPRRLWRRFRSLWSGTEEDTFDQLIRVKRQGIRRVDEPAAHAA